MKRHLFLLTMVCMLLFLGTQAFSNDTDELKKLQPLSVGKTGEQKIYDEVKNNATELHEFIQARTFIRGFKKILRPDYTGGDIDSNRPEIEKLYKDIYKTAWDKNSLKKIMIKYCTTAKEQSFFFYIINVDYEGWGKF